MAFLVLFGCYLLGYSFVTLRWISRILGFVFLLFLRCAILGFGQLIVLILAFCLVGFVCLYVLCVLLWVYVCLGGVWF